MSYTPVTATITGSSIYANQQLLGLYELTGGDNIVLDSSGTIATTLDPSFTTLNVDGATSLMGDVSFGGDISANSASITNLTVGGTLLVTGMQGKFYCNRKDAIVFADSGQSSDTDYYLHFNDIEDYIDSEYYSYTQPHNTNNNANEGLRIKKAGHYRIHFNFVFQNNGFTGENQYCRVAPVVNTNVKNHFAGHSDASESGSTTRGNCQNTFLREFAADDYLKFLLKVSKDNSGYSGNFSKLRWNSCNVFVEYLGS